jgi:single-strand DNA-binding protein
VTNRWKSESGEIREHTEWMNIEAWGRLAETCHEYLGKGSLVYIEGRMKTDRYEDEGETRYFTKVVAQSVQFLSNNPADHSVVEGVEEEDLESMELAESS